MIKLSHSYSSLKLFETCPLKYYRLRIKKDVRDTGSAATVHGQRIHEYLEYRLKKDKWLPQEIAHYEPLCEMMERLAKGGELFVEHELVITEALTPTGWWDKDAWLRSKLDVFIINGDTAVIADWKVGRRWPDMFQLQLSAAQVFKRHPQIKRVKAILVWLKTMELDSETFYAEKAPDMWADILRHIKRIEAAVETDNWPARPSPLCRWCPARDTCEFAKT